MCVHQFYTQLLAKTVQWSILLKGTMVEFLTRTVTHCKFIGAILGLVKK